ncbi:MAG: chromosome segregation protein SMC [Desulfurobacteriaceae bacterium]
MYIKSLKLKGFKSFADETEIRFSKGINCIVGPNGCGKSNIVDALKWIIGDTSIKGMRADNIKDIIFKGAEGRKPSKVAEVSILLAEDDLFSENSKVLLTRKVKTNGDSEFLINDRKVRLKDIKDFFTSIGLGAKDYAFFEQGQIDRVLRMKPSERKVLIDEAAQVLSFKEKREETLRKLSEAEQNLENVKNIINEVGKNLRNLKNQAEKAKEFQSLKKLERELELKLLGFELRNLRLKRDVLEGSLKVFQEDRTSLEREIANLEATLESLRNEFETITKEIEETSKELAEIEKSKKEASVKKDFLGKEIERLKKEIEEKTFEREEKFKKIQKVKNELEELLLEEEKLKLEISKLEKEEKQKENKLNLLLKEKTEIEKAIKDLRSKLSSITTQISKIQLDVAREEERFKSYKNLKAKLPKELSELDREKEYYSIELKRLLEKEENLKEELKSLEAEVEKVKEEKRELTFRIDQLEEEIASKKEDVAVLKSRIESTKKFLSTFNFGRLEKKIVESGKAGKVKGFVGLLINFLEVKDGFEKVVERIVSLLGAGIILENFEDVLWVKDRIKGNGEVWLLSLDLDPVEVSKVEGAEPLLNFVKPKDEKFRNLINVLFNGVFFVEKTEKAIELAKKFPNYTFIDGSLNIFSGKGSLVGKGKQNSLLEMEKEIKKLQDKFSKEIDELSSLRKKLSPLKEELREKDWELDSLKEKIQKKKMEIFELSSKIKESKKKISELERRKEDLSEKLKRAEETLASFSSKMEIFERKLKELEGKKGEKISLLEKLENELKDLEDRILKQRETVSSYSSSKVLLLEKLRNVKEKREGKERFIKTLQREIEEIEKKIEKDRKLLEKAKEDLERSYNILNGVDETINEIRLELKTLEERRNEISGLVKTKEEALKLKSKDLQEVQKKLKEAEINLARLNVKEEETISKILDLDSSVQEALELSSTVKEEDKIEEELSRVKEKIAKIGSVNLLAIEEYEKVKERYGFILEQEKDLVESIKNLKEAIKKLDEEIEKRFTKTFNDVNKNFKKAFRQIFGGGSARLILQDDGIEIEAKPPGKKHGSINLLSGGERTLVALAFLYALYSVRPAPFVVLDEVDAALDDANTLRFIELLKQMALETQVIVVTHNKLTMEAADVLYGITMEVPGISKVIGVSFENLSTV